MQKLKKHSLFLYLFLCLISLTTVRAQIQTANDSITFEQQRTRVNDLLDERSKRFGEFDLSLQQKTGVFGIFKTKGDMQKSIDILKKVVIADNNIFVETKKLLDLKNYQSERYAALATEYDKQVLAYMKTINKLQTENDKLREQVDKSNVKDQDSNIFVYLLIAVILVLLIAIYQLYKQKKTKN